MKRGIVFALALVLALAVCFTPIPKVSAQTLPETAEAIKQSPRGDANFVHHRAPG